MYVSYCLRVYTWAPSLSCDNWSVFSWWHSCWKKAVLVLNFLFDSSNNLSCELCGAHTLAWIPFPLWGTSNEQALCSPNVSIVFKFLLPSAPRGNYTDMVSVHQKEGWTVALSILGHNMQERAAAPLRSYHEEPEFSSAPMNESLHFSYSPCGSLFHLSFSSTLKQFLKSIVKGISNCIWPIDHKRQPSPMAVQYSLHPGAQKTMFGWLIEGHELVNYNLEFLVIWKKYLKSVLTQSLKFRWCIRRSWVLHKPLCS